MEVVALDRNRLLLELLLISEDGSTLEIDDDGRPVFAPHVEPERQRAQRRAVHDGIRAYQRHVNGYRLTGGDEHLGAVDALVGRRIIERFVVEPTPEEARTFGEWQAEDDYNSFEASPLVPHDRDPILRRLTRKQLAGSPSSASSGPPAPARCGRIRWRRPPPARCPRPGRCASSFSALTEPGRAASRRCDCGREGVAIGSWSGDAGGVCGVTVFPVLIDGLLRFDSLRVTLISTSSGWRSDLWSWSAGDDPQTLSMANAHGWPRTS